MLSLFSFLVALGIVVDDAIVIGENIYAHLQMGKPRLQAAIDGTTEVMPSVTASVTTTVIAFAPMFFVSGVMGKFMAVIPFAVIAMLVISLWESIFVLPCHLSHKHTGFFRLLSILIYPLRPIGLGLGWLSERAGRGMMSARDRYYLPFLDYSLSYPLVPIAAALMMLMATAGMIRAASFLRSCSPNPTTTSFRRPSLFPTERRLRKPTQQRDRWKKQFGGSAPPLASGGQRRKIDRPNQSTRRPAAG